MPSSVPVEQLISGKLSEPPSGGYYAPTISICQQETSSGYYALNNYKHFQTFILGCSANDCTFAKLVGFSFVWPPSPPHHSSHVVTFFCKRSILVQFLPDKIPGLFGPRSGYLVKALSFLLIKPGLLDSLIIKKKLKVG